MLDFGIAKLLRPEGETTVGETATETRGAPGTLPYMAPEQLQGEAVDVRTDLYTLGVLLYEMATGERPFREDIATRLIDAILHQTPTTPRAINARVPPEAVTTLDEEKGETSHRWPQVLPVEALSGLIFFPPCLGNGHAAVGR